MSLLLSYAFFNQQVREKKSLSKIILLFADWLILNWQKIEAKDLLPLRTGFKNQQKCRKLCTRHAWEEGVELKMY